MLVMLYYSEEEDGEDPQSAFIVAGAHNIEQLSGDEDFYAISTYQNHEQYDPVAVSNLLYCIMRPYTEGRLDRYHIGIPRELSEFRTQPWLSEGSLTCNLYHHRKPIF